MKAPYGIVATAFLVGVPAQAQTTDPVPEIVSIMQTFAGKGAKHRPSGAKGQCYKGTFEPTADAKALSKSPIFAKPSTVLARFSVGSGNPKVADGNKAVNRGFSFKIDVDGKGQTEFVMINAPVNFSKSPEQMLGFLRARVPGADGKPDPEKIKAFAEANPETTAQGKYLAGQPIAGSWVGVNYWGIHAYKLVNGAGAEQLIKFKMVPTGGLVTVSDEDAKAKPADYLVEELADRLKRKAPASFDMLAIMGRSGDPTNNVTVMWDNEDARPTTKLGTLSITAVESNETCDANIFDPTNLASGISGPADDPMFAPRQPAYAISSSGRR